MTVNTFITIDDFLDDAESHLESIMSNPFMDVDSDVGVFRNIQDRSGDIVGETIEKIFPKSTIAYNFVRMSPQDQEEPTYIHNDLIMGDVTCILYLSKEHPDEDGTSIYNVDDNKKSIEFRSKFNKMIIFDSKHPHSRNIFSNFGVGKSSRLIQVIFLKNK
jgi:hypothetical protein